VEFGAPEQLQPSPDQWRSIVVICSGVLTNSSFPQVVDQFMDFGPALRPQGGVDIFTKQMILAGDVKSVVKALHAISELSTGKLAGITLTGTKCCGWLAAVGYWFFGLSVRIEQASDISSDSNKILFETAAPQENAQITVI